MKKNLQMITIVPHGEIIQQQWDTVIHVYECDIWRLPPGTKTWQIPEWNGGLKYHPTKWDEYSDTRPGVDHPNPANLVNLVVTKFK